MTQATTVCYQSNDVGNGCPEQSVVHHSKDNARHIQMEVLNCGCGKMKHTHQERDWMMTRPPNDPSIPLRALCHGNQTQCSQCSRLMFFFSQSENDLGTNVFQSDLGCANALAAYCICLSAITKKKKKNLLVTLKVSDRENGWSVSFYFLCLRHDHVGKKR